MPYGWMANDLCINITIGGLKLMVDLKLENDERIICRVRDAGISDGKTNDTLEGLFLTNRHLISVYEKTFALFSKEKMIIDKKPLELISSCNDEIQVATVKDDEFEVALHIFYDNGMDYLYSLGEDVPKSMYLQWEDAIKKAVIENRKNIPLKEENNSENVESTFSTTITKETNENNEPIKDLNAICCAKCGAKNSFEAKFCQSCSFPMQVINNPQSVEKMPNVPQQKTSDMTQNNETTFSDRRQEFIGKILKCPVCGEIIPSFTAICPACGHELNSIKNSDILESFIEQVNKCEELIASNKTRNKQGWATWGIAQKIGWVFLNIIFFCIPLFFYFIWRYLMSPILGLIRIKTKPILSKEEQQMVSLIENFPFPNDRETILAALIFAKEKIDFISKEHIDRKSAYWGRLWCSKAEQLKQKADILFPNDTVVKNSYEEILTDKASVKKTLQIKAVAGVVLFVAVLIFFLVRRGTFNDIQISNAPLTIPVTELSAQMPQIENGKGKVVTNNAYYFSVEYYGISDAGFEEYKRMCKDEGFTIDCESDGSLFDAYNENGYNIRITYFNNKMNVTIKDKEDMGTLVWPSTEVADLLPRPNSDYGYVSSASDSCVIIYVGNMTIDDYKEYVAACMEKGFANNLSQTSKHYHADDSEGNHVLVEYCGYDTVFIRIDD